MLRIDELRVRDFRGICGEHTFDLHAPMTVLYAPNGTGKTSVLDAVEWCLLGQVKRLAFGSAEKLRCRTGHNNGPLVELSVRNEVPGLQSEMGLIREDLSLRERTPRGSRIIKEKDLWERIVGSRKVGTSQQTNTARASWIRSTHFLDGEDIAHLLDTHPEYAEHRGQLLADLLGVGHEREQRDHLQRVLGDSKLRGTWPNAGVDDAERKLRDAEDELTSLGATPVGPIEDIVSRMAAVAVELDETLGTSDRPEHLLTQLLRFLADANAKAGRAFKHLESAIVGLSDSVPIADRIQTAREEVNTSAALEREASAATAKASAEAMSFDVIIQSAKDKHEGLVGLRLGLIELQGALPEPMPSREVAERRLAEHQAELQAQRALLSLVVDARRATASQQLALSRFTEAHRTTDEASASLNELRQQAFEFGPIDTALTQDAAAIAETNQELARLGDAQTLLLETGRQLVESDHDSAACPLCGTEYNDHGRLVNAIDTMIQLAQAPAAELYRKLEFQRARFSRLQQLKDRLNAAEDALGQAKMVERLMNEDLQTAQAALSRSLEALVLRPPVEAILDVVLAQRQTAVQSRANDLAEVVQDGQRLMALHARWDAFLGQGAALGLLLFGTSLDTGGLQVALETLDAESHRIGEQIAALHGQRLLLSASVDSARREWEQAQERANQMRSNLSVLETQFAGLRASLDALGYGPRTPSVDELVIRLQDVRRAMARLPEMDERVSAITSDLREATQRVLLQRRAEEAKRDLSQARRLQQVRQRWITNLESDVKVLAAQEKRLIQERFEPLQSMVWSIYSRGQAHRVIDGIAHNVEGQSIDWLLKLTQEHTLSAPELSRGQRIDLALAFFLARAGADGGTVFLDEPLIHLDTLNRAAVLDTFRVLALTRPNLRVVMTTADRGLLRHLRQKFALLASTEGSNRSAYLRIYTLSGTPQTTLQVEVEAVERIEAHDPLSLLPRHA